MNKRGGVGKGFIISFSILAVVILVAYIVVQTGAWESFTKDVPTDTGTEGFAGTFFGENFDWLKYIFGGIPVWLSAQTSTNNAGIVVIATFVLLMVTFADIITMFSTFSKGTSWVAAIAIAIIAANLKAIVSILAIFIGIFSFLGGLAVIAGLSAAFVAFLLANLGIGSFEWIRKRRIMMAASEDAASIEAGGAKLGATITAMDAASQALAKSGKPK